MLFINKSTIVVLWFHTSQNFLSCVAPFSSHISRALTPPRLRLKHKPVAKPCTSGSRISITWMSGGFPSRQKADPAGWDGNRVSECDKYRGQEQRSPDTHTHQAKHYYVNIHTNTLTWWGGWCLTAPYYNRSWVFPFSVPSQSQIMCGDCWRMNTGGKQDTFNFIFLFVFCFCSLIEDIKRINAAGKV